MKERMIKRADNFVFGVKKKKLVFFYDTYWGKMKKKMITIIIIQGLKINHVIFGLE